MEEEIRMGEEQERIQQQGQIQQQREDLRPQQPMNGGGDNQAVGAGDNQAVGAGDNQAVGAGDNQAVGAGDNQAVGAGDNQAAGAGDNQAVGAGDDQAGGGGNDIVAGGGNDRVGAGGNNNAGIGGDGQNAGDDERDEGERQHNAGGAGGVPGANQQQAAGRPQMDNINLEIGQVYADIADGQRRADENQQDNHDPFDKLEDLAKKKMKKESKKGRTSQQENGAGQAGATQGQDGNAPDDGPQGTKKNVDNLRGSSLYMAVVLARELEKGGKNPMADNKFIRYFKSSKFDSVADKVKLAGAVSSTLGSFDKQYGRSAISQGVGIVSNMVTIVSSVKAFSQKLKKYRASGSKLDKAFGAIGMLTDLTMILSKAIGIAQNILALMKVHQSKIFQSVVKYVKMILGGITQIGLVMTGTKGLVDAKKKLGMMSAMENKRWAVIEQSVLPRYNEQENDGQGEEEEIHEGEAPAPNPAQPPVQTEAQAEGQGGGRLSLKQKREQAKQRRATRKGRRNLANMLLKREDVADEDKDKLALYLASCRMYGKIKSGIIMGASGLVVSAIGLSTSIASGTALSGDLNAAKAAKNLGMMGAIGGIGVAGLKVGMGHNDRKAQNNEETQVIKGRLWGLIHGLDDEKYGLKGISEGLEANPSPEKAAEAKGVVDKYNAVDGQMKGAFVNYDRLLKAANAEDFRNMLVADL